MIKLTPAMKKFVLHWGEMGTRWGVNRTVAQIHALLFLSKAPLTAEQIAATLKVARSNVSNSLRELQSWGLVRVVHVLGDRRDHFESPGDVWEMFRLVAAERKRREIDPTLALLREWEAADAPGTDDDHARARLRELADFFQTVSTWYDQMEALPLPQAVKFLKSGSAVLKRMGLRGR